MEETLRGSASSAVLARKGIGFAAKESDDEDELARELRAYVDSLRGQADSLCGQVQEEVKKHHFVRSGNAVPNDDGYWSEWTEKGSHGWKTRALKAEKKNAEAEKRVVDAELRVAAVEASSPTQDSGAPGRRELKLNDLLPMLRRLGVQITIGSDTGELDTLMAEVLGSDTLRARLYPYPTLNNFRLGCWTWW
jgi:hypothetical protein